MTEIATMDEYIKKFTIADMFNHYQHMLKLQATNRRKNNRYKNTEKGRAANRESSKKYYYKKNNIYHEKYNPDGIKKKKKT